MKRWLKRMLASKDRVIVRISTHHIVPTADFDVVMKGKFKESLEALYSLMGEYVLGALPPSTDQRLASLGSLIGLTAPQGICLIELLSRTSGLDGAVCEMGIAQGRTSVLIAQEMRESARELWLFDSFTGLPEPTADDELLDDLFGLGSMAAYAGTMNAPRHLVEQGLRECDFPAERVHIVEGYFDETTRLTTPLPESVSFAFVDFDLYKPIRDALEYLDLVLQEGGYIAIHDYGYFSSGAKKAVDEFLADRPQRYALALPHPVVKTMAILERTRSGEDEG